MRPPRICEQLLLMACFITASAISIPNFMVERQAASCAAGATYAQCAGSGLPDDFCCPKNATCALLAGSTTVLCCPNGDNCGTIKPITCDISQQNATIHPESMLKTNALTGTLDFCGVSCCPFGYSCNADGNCAQNSDQTKAPATSASAIPSPTATSTSSASNTTITTAPTSDAKKGSSFPTAPVVGGIAGGLALGIGITVFLIWFCGSRRRKAQQQRESASSSSFGKISDPQPIHPIRTDFLRKPPETPSSMSSSPTPERSGTIHRVRSLFRKSTSTPRTSPNPQAWDQSSRPASPPPIPMLHRNRNQNQSTSPQELPVTPMTPRDREPSYVDIDIFADGDTASSLRQRERLDYQSGVPSTPGMGMGPVPSMRRDSGETTFSDMMRQSGLAGLQKGQPYIYRDHTNSPPNPPSPPR